MYKFWRINRWVHQYYDLPLKKFLDPWRDKLIQHFYNNPPPKGLYNVICNIDEVNSYLDNIFSSVIENYYNIDPTYKEKHINLYIQNDNNYNSVWHNHTQGTSTITGVIYISPQKRVVG